MFDWRSPTDAFFKMDACQNVLQRLSHHLRLEKKNHRQCVMFHLTLLILCVLYVCVWYAPDLERHFLQSISRTSMNYGIAILLKYLPKQGRRFQTLRYLIINIRRIDACCVDVDQSRVSESSQHIKFMWSYEWNVWLDWLMTSGAESLLAVKPFLPSKVNRCVSAVTSHLVRHRLSRCMKHRKQEKIPKKDY